MIFKIIFQSVILLSVILYQNYPNPFNPSTMISYFLPRSSTINLSIFNSLGQLVRTLINAKQQAGEHRITWDGKDNQGDQTASGIYIYRLQAEDFDQTKKMLFIQ